MTRRIDVELTSNNGGETWTWRAAGAKLPKGSVPATLVPEGSAVGSVLRAEVENGIDGIEVLALSVPADPQAGRPVVERIEILGSGKQSADVTVTLAKKGRGGRDGERRGGRDGDRRGPRGEGGDRRGPRREGGGPRSDRRGARREGGDRPERGALPQSTVHRNALLAELRAEQVPVAEQLLRGGLPSVREAIAEQERSARQQGQPAPASEAILRMAEDLLPVTSLAAWKDRAAAVHAAGKDVRLRDLRTTAVAAKTVTLDEEGRVLSKQLHEQLEHRIKGMETGWVEVMEKALTEGRVVDALAAVASPPDRSLRCSADLAGRISEAAGLALNTELAPAAWIDLARAASSSPMRRTIKPAGIPADENAQAVARSLAGSIPDLARQLGLKVPPPPPRRPAPHPRRATPPENAGA